MHTVFIACFAGGAVATGLFAVLNWIGGIGHGSHAQVSHTAHLHLHSGHAPPAQTHAGPGVRVHGHVGSHAVKGSAPGGVSRSWLAASGSWTLSWLSPLTLSAAALWFGGIGLLTEGSPVALILAIVAGVLGAAFVRWLMNAFMRASTPPLQLTGEGALATVNATIRPDAPGEVLYTLEGLHRTAPARSTDGRAIPRGSDVVIVRQEGGFAWVEPLGAPSELEAPDRQPLRERKD